MSKQSNPELTINFIKATLHHSVNISVKLIISYSLASYTNTAVHYAQCFNYPEVGGLVELYIGQS